VAKGIHWFRCWPLRCYRRRAGNSADHSHIGFWLAEEPFQNIRLRVVASITSKTGSNRHWLPANIRCQPALLNIWAASASASTRSASQACELASWQGSSRAMPVDVSRIV
jgi:hypothetical protein